MTPLLARVLAVAFVLLRCVAPAGAALSSGEVHVWEMQEITLPARRRRYANPYADVDVLDRARGPGLRAPRVRVLGRRAHVQGPLRRDGAGRVALALGLEPARRRRAERRPRAAARGGVDRGREAREPEPPRLRARHGQRPRARSTPTARRSSCSATRGSRRRRGGCPWRGVPRRAGLRARARASASRRRSPTASGRASTRSASSRRSRTGTPTSTARPSRTRTASTCATPGRSSATGRRTPRVTTADGATTTAKDMADEQGNRPFEVLADRDGLADFDRLNPAYFRSLDRKMRHLADAGLRAVPRDRAPRLLPVLEGVLRLRRLLRPLRPVPDRALRRVQPRLQRHPPRLDPEGLQPHRRRVQRGAHATTGETYGAAAVRPAVHDADRQLDLQGASATATSAARGSRCTRSATSRATTRSTPRSRSSSGSSPPYPAANLEPYYTGWNHEINRPGGETPAPDSDRDNYFARVDDVRLGAVGRARRPRARHRRLRRHEHGRAARLAPLHLGGAALRVGRARCSTCGASCCPRATATSSSSPPRTTSCRAAPPDALGRRPRRLGLHDAHRRPAARAALLRAEGGRPARGRPRCPAAAYVWTLVRPADGQRLESPPQLTDGSDGALRAPPFPGGGTRAAQDWAAKLKRAAGVLGE